MTLYSCYNASDVRNELHGVFFFFFFPQMFHKVKITAKKSIMCHTLIDLAPM